MTDKNEGIKINAYIGSLTCSSMGKRTIRLDIPESEAVEFLSAMTMYGKHVEITIKEITEGE